MLRVETVTAGSQGAPFFTQMYFGDTPTGDAADAVSSVQSFWTNLAPIISASLVMTVSGQVATVDTATGEITDMTSVTGATVLGTDLATILPFSTQGVIKWNTGSFQAGRQIVGRTFIPGMCQESGAAGVPGGDQLEAMGVAADALLNDTGTPFGIYSRKNLAFFGAQSGTPWTQWGILRSRRD